MPCLAVQTEGPPPGEPRSRPSTQDSNATLGSQSQAPNAFQILQSCTSRSKTQGSPVTCRMIFANTQEPDSSACALGSWTVSCCSLHVAPCLIGGIGAPWVHIAVLLEYASATRRGWRGRRSRRRRWSRSRLHPNMRCDPTHGIEHTRVDCGPTTTRCAPGCGPVHCPPSVRLFHQGAAAVATASRLIPCASDAHIFRCSRRAAAADVGYLCLLESSRHGQPTRS